MRAGEIDIICPVSLQDAQEMGKTNPEIVQIPLPFSMTATIDPRIDKALSTTSGCARANADGNRPAGYR